MGVPLEGPGRLIFEVRSWLKSGSGLDEGGEMEFCVEFPLEWKEMVLLSDGANGLAARGAELAWTGAGAGGARPFPFPKILPPPSFRPDIVQFLCGSSEGGIRIDYAFFKLSRQAHMIVLFKG